MKIKEGFVLREMCGERIVTATGMEHINFNKLISLNDSAAYLWKELEGKEFTVEEMAKLLMERYEISEETALRDSESLCEKWRSIGITE